MSEAAANRRLLIVDPCDECRQLLPDLRSAGWDVTCCTFSQALQHACDVGLLRLQASHLSEPEAVQTLIERSDTEWIAALSAEELRLQNVGDFVCEWFFDFHTLPFDPARVQVTLARAHGMARLRSKGSGPARVDEQAQELLGESRSLRELRKLLGKLAADDSPVLIRGESGSGKELAARILHRQSPRRDKPFVTFNCAAIPQDMVRSELFGHEKGAFPAAYQRKIGRIEAADGGILFLDEVAELPADLQASLLDVLEHHHVHRLGGDQPIPVDVRILSSTHVDLEEAIENARFREDLYHHLNVLQVSTTPLRERHGDLAMLANHFARFYSLETGRRPRSFSDRALAAMARHDWPGNVRELANRVRRGLVLAEGRQIEAQDLGLQVLDNEDTPMGTLEDYKYRAEHQALCDVLNRHSDNMSIAAKVLGVSRPTFYRLLHKHHIR